MENKEKRKISMFTIFLWLALIVTMSVVVISGISKSNALEDESVKDSGITGVKTIKLDLTEIIENVGITEQTEIEAFLEEYSEKIKVSNENNSTSIVNADVTYVGSEQNFIGIYEINIVNEAKYIRIESNEYEILNNNEVLEIYCYLGKGYYFKKLSESIDEYSFVIRKKDTKIVTIKIDFTDLIKDRGITEQSEIETLLESYNIFLGLIDKDRPISFFTLKTKYISSEKSTIGVYEVEITNDVKYIELLGGCYEQYDAIFDGGLLELTWHSRASNGYFNLLINRGGNYIQKILDGVDKYDIVLEKKEEITINTSEEITKIGVLNHTNKTIEYVRGRDGKFNFKKSNRCEYDIIFEPYDVYTDYYGNREYKYQYRGVYEDGKELEQKVVYAPYFGVEINSYYRTIKQGENKSEYTFETNGQFESSILWEDDKHAKLQFKLRENWLFYGKYGKYGYSNFSGYYETDIYKTYDYYYYYKYIVFIEQLDENFKISEEYEKDSKWLIANEEEIKDTKFEIPEYAKKYLKLDLENNEYIPEYVYANLFLNNFNIFDIMSSETYIKSNEKIYNIYIKDKNMLYCLVPADKPNIMISVNLEYNCDKDEKDKVFNFNTKSILFNNQINPCERFYEQSYVGSTLTKKQITYNEDIKTRIIINKIVENKEENKIYYVGLFDNENDSNTDKIYEIDVVNGKGNVKIEFDGYDENKKYYIYEVDESGNKIENDKLIYNKNKVLENVNKKEEYNILSNNSIISSVYSTLANEGYLGINVEGGLKTVLITLSEDIGKGMGEDYYKDNSLVATEVYEDIVTISENNEKPYLVRYETKRGGKLEGKLEEVVMEGNKPVNVPNIRVNDGYEFDKWVVIKDGKEVEVDPSEYVILEDTTFIAKYKEIKIIENEDTSDINVWLYVGVAVISIIVAIIIVIVLVIIKNKNK